MEGSFQLKYELKKIQVLFRVFVGLNIIHAIDFHRFSVGNLFQDVIQIVILGAFFYLFNKTFKKLNYSFWTFSFFYILYYSFNFYACLGTYKVYTLLLLGLLFLSICYSMNTPLYYPRVHWWEYDFRYKGDLKIRVPLNGEDLDGRLFDLRRDAGCITLFKKIKIGERELIHLDFEDKSYTFRIEIVTAKSNSIGRGFIHGVKFLLTDEQEKAKYSYLSKSWRKLVKSKIREKFNETSK